MSKNSDTTTKILLVIAKIFLALIYIPIWLTICLVTFFFVVPPGPGWIFNLKAPQREDDDNNYDDRHNFDPHYKDEEFFDIIDDD